MTIFYRVRKKLKLSQAKMAEQVGVARQTWQLLEYGELLPSFEVAERIHQLTAEFVPCLADCIDSKEARIWSTVRPYEFLQASRETWARVHEYCENMTELYRRISPSLLGWMENMLVCESIPEGFYLLQLAMGGAKRMIGNPHQLGFRDQPIVDGNGQTLGERSLPGLQGELGELRYLLWPQVGLRPRSATFRLDGLMLLRYDGRCCWTSLEIDSVLHDPERDKVRRKLIGLPEIRISQDEVEYVRAVDCLRRQAQGLFGKAA